MKRTVLLLMWTLGVLAAHAQYVPAVNPPKYDKIQHWGGAFQHLDVMVTLGTTGIGVEALTPLGENWRLRGGVTYLPWFSKTMTTDVYVGKDQSHFNDVSELMQQWKGYRMLKQVKMSGMLSMFNAKILVDYFPLDDNKKFRVTAGLFYGPARIANITPDSRYTSTLATLAAYNHLYETAEPGDPIRSWGYAGLYMGQYAQERHDEVHDVDHVEGETYLMLPDDNGDLSIELRTNSLKPYLGVGYEFGFLKKNENLKLGIDAGVLFWGGAPTLRVSSDGVNLVKDIKNVPGKKGDYVSKINKLVVFPVISVSLIYHIL